MSGCDVLLINPGNPRQVYQDLSRDFSAVEPPYLIAALGAYLRLRGIRVSILDIVAENITAAEAASRAQALGPLLAAVIVYGSQPSASTQLMSAAGNICRELKRQGLPSVALGGLHPSALPAHTLKEESADFVIEGEGFYTLERLARELRAGRSAYSSVPGLWYMEKGSARSTPRAELVNDFDGMFALASWDLLPMDKYRAHNWHCFDNIDERSPYAAIYSSFGCPYNCMFCCINAPFGKPGIRYRGPETVVKEIDTLAVKYGVRNIKIADELFVLRDEHYMRITDMLIERGYGLNIWAYARVDTIKEDNLARMKKAGINWLALGIESANPAVRDGALKNMRRDDIFGLVRRIQDSGIRVIGNFIFGLPEDTMGTMEETFDMAVRLNCEFANFYCAMAYPGSKLYDLAIKAGWELPAEWHGFSQHSYEMLPLPTKYLRPDEVLRFRDEAFCRYFSGSLYLDMVESKFGARVRRHVEDMTSVRLKRRILGDDKK